MEDGGSRGVEEGCGKWGGAVGVFEEGARDQGWTGLVCGAKVGRSMGGSEQQRG